MKIVNIGPLLTAGLLGLTGAGLSGCNSSDEGKDVVGQKATEAANQTAQQSVMFDKISDKLKKLDGYQLRVVDTDQGARVLLSSETYGVVITDATGKVLGRSTGDDKSVDVRLVANAQDGSDAGLWVSHIDETENALKLGYFDLDNNRYQSLTWDQQWSQTMVVACLSASTEMTHPEHTELTAWLISEEGMAYQEQLLITQNGVTSTRVRDVALGEGVVACSVDDRDQKLYWSQENIGLLALNSDEEKDEGRLLLAALAPAGDLQQAPSSLQVLPASGLILATIPDQEQAVIYSPEGEVVTSVNYAVSGGDSENPDPITSVALQKHSDSQWHWWAMTDEGKYLLTASSESLVTLPERTSQDDSTYTVLPTAQTDVVNSFGDAADDPEVWVNAGDAGRSLIIATDKKQGLWSYNLDGEKQQFLPRGNVNNVDVRYNFTLTQGGESRVVDLAMATNRTTENLDVFAIDQQTGKLDFIAGDIIDGSLGHPYGGCLYSSKNTGEIHAFVNNKNGLYQQWRLVAKGNTVHGEKVHEFKLNGQPEGCVADDETGRLFVGEEDHGIWSIELEAGESSELKLLDETANGHLVADVEGMSLYTGKDGQGYLVVSSQGDNAYVLYDRVTNEYLGRFRVKANAALSIDGSSETDGLAVTSANLGGAFDQGLLVVQDGRNRMPSARQNFKLVPWRAVEEGLHKYQSEALVDH